MAIILIGVDSFCLPERVKAQFGIPNLSTSG